MSNPQWSNYSEFYQRSEYASFLQEHRVSNGQLPFRMILVQQSSHNFCDPALPESIIALPLEVEPGCSWNWEINNKHYHQKSRSGSMLLVPADTESHWEVNARRTLLVLALPNITVKKLLGSACPEDFHNLFSPLTQQTWEEPLVESMIKRLWGNSASKSMANSCLSDGLLTSIFAQLLLMSDTKLDTQSRIFLPKWRLNRIKNYVEAHISEEICLDDLARAAGLSVRHLTRNFQKETGETPHRWVMKVRTEKAATLLSDTELSINDIAQLCGFSSQSHLTSSLKILTGLTPLRWRHVNRR